MDDLFKPYRVEYGLVVDKRGAPTGESLDRGVFRRGNQDLGFRLDSLNIMTNEQRFTGVQLDSAARFVNDRGLPTDAPWLKQVEPVVPMRTCRPSLPPPIKSPYRNFYNTEWEQEEEDHRFMAAAVAYAARGPR